MKSISRFLKGITLAFIAVCAVNSVSAQGRMPLCSGTGAGMVYFSSKDSIWVIDPANPGTVTWTGVQMPLGASGNGKGLAISKVLPGGSSTPTYYTTMITTGLSRIVHYWDNAAGVWVSTGHVLNQDHIAGGGGFIYGIDPTSGFVFKYDGTGSATFLVAAGTITSGPMDIAADCAGNFYVMTVASTTGTLKKYSSSGALLTTYTLSGNVGAAGGGLAINGNLVFYDGADGKMYAGVISGTNVSFSSSAPTPFSALPANDFASCGYAGFDGNKPSIDTFKSCNGATNVSLTATGPGPYNWTVVSGPGTITGSGQTVTVNASNTTVIVHNDANCAGVNSIPDTNVIFIANLSIRMDPDRTIYSCGQPVTDSFTAHLTNQTPGLAYGYNTTPFLSIIGSPSDTVVHFQISKTTIFVFEATTLSGCSFKDSIKIKVVDSTPHADFQFVRKYGCDEDTVVFFNLSYGGVDSFAWFFEGDSLDNPIFRPYPPYFKYTDAVNPTNIFKEKGFYPVRLLAKNAYCTDTINKQVDINHVLDAYWGADIYNACADHVFQFKDSSKSRYPPGTPGYKPAIISYYFGDGTKALNQANPTHTYGKTGTYTAFQVLTDFKGCTDTFKRTIVIDSLPFVRLTSPDTLLCQGQAIRINADYLTVGNTGTTLDMGDGTIYTNTSSATYSYLEPRTYTITFTASYRFCPSSIQTYTINVRPFPGINLGPDTVLCPNGQPIVLSDRTNLGNTTATYLWNTGEKTQAIYARNIGTYWARVNVGGCTATDSVVIKKDCFVDIPNSFTPNGDGTNDYFLPRQYLSRSVNEFKMTIYNRWGQKVFETVTTDGRGWDGKFNGQDQPQGVYVYQIEVGFDSGVKEHYTGNLTLLR